MNIFDLFNGYFGNWKEVSRRKLTAEEKSAIQSNKITRGDYGLSVAFLMTTGVTKFIPLSNRSHLTEGQSVDIQTVDLVCLERDGKQTWRIED